MPADKNINELIFNQLTRKEYDDLLKQDLIDEDQIYLITDHANAYSISYNNVESKLAATNVQAAIDEVNRKFSDYLLLKDVPKKLPNPNAIKFTGAVNSSYDGSAPLEVNIPNTEDLGKKWVLKKQFSVAQPGKKVISEDLSPLNLKEFKIIFKINGTNEGTFRSYLKVGEAIEWMLYDVPVRRDNETVAILEVKNSGVPGLKEEKLTVNANRPKRGYGNNDAIGFSTYTNVVDYLGGFISNFYLDSLMDLNGSSVYILSLE